MMATPTTGQTTGQFIGIQKLHVAEMLTDVPNGTATYDTMLDMGKVLIEVQIEPTNNDATLYADNQAIDTANVTQEYNLTFTTAALPLEYKAFLLGHKVENGVMIADANDTAPYFGLAFQADKRNGKARFVKFFKVQFAEPSETNTTKGENIEYNTPSLTAKAIYRLCDGKVYVQGDEESPGWNTTVGTNWYSGMGYTTLSP